MIEYAQLAQVRENSTNAVSIYSPDAGKTVQCYLRIVNVSDSDANVTVYHDNDGHTYDESTVITAVDLLIEAGSYVIIDKIFMNNSDGNLAYKSSIDNALTATLYGIVK